MTKLSAVIITLNEEKNIKRCLNSLIGVVDEVVVVDSYSRDATKKICLGYYCKFIEKRWNGYSQSKNFANSQASNDLILSIDADEELSDELKNSIIELKKNVEYDAYTFNRRTNYCGKWINHCGWYPDTKIRIFNRKQAKWEGEIHEKLVMSPEAKVGQLKGELLHHAYSTISAHISQINKYSDLYANYLFKSGKKVSICKLIFAPCIRFIRDYIFRLGFLDGIYGFIICKNNAYSILLRYMKLKYLITNQKNLPKKNEK